MRTPAALVVLGALFLRAETADGSISVLVFDYGRVPANILQAGHAGIEPDSAISGCRAAGARGAHPASGTSRRQAEPNAFGFAAPAENGGFGTYACIFYDRIEQLGPAINKSAVLGHVIAHELGHLLLGVGHHSGGGIMKADWRRDHLKRAAERALRFYAEEGRRMFENVQRRILAAHAMPPSLTCHMAENGRQFAN